ncbi:MAG: ABC transporter permease [Alphaproteobacteria bacterium]|nr:ABC transporter permease [Alphaproteobacteria bacterium]
MNPFTVFRPKRFAALFAADTSNVGRDPVMVAVLVFAIAQTVAFVLWRADIDRLVFDWTGLADVTGFVAAMVLVMPALLIGWVGGFLLLEDRDDGTLLAVQVTPIGKTGYVGYRLMLGFMVSAAFTLVAAPFVLGPDFGWAFVAFMALLIGLQSTVTALVLVALASNRVEGLAITKLLNMAALFPLLAIIPGPWRLVFGLIPQFWIGELLEFSAQPVLPAAMIWILALAIHLGVAGALFHLTGLRRE